MEQDRKIQLGQRIKELREQKGLTLEKLAYENDIAKSTLSRIERGLVDVKYTTLLKIAEGLGIKTKELLDL
jgi:transcriptional regulator with XRE-family HTH domain